MFKRGSRLIFVANCIADRCCIQYACIASPLPQAAPPEWAPPGNLLVWESFNKINPVLQWNQPHMVWLADVQVRTGRGSRNVMGLPDCQRHVPFTV